MSGSGLRVSGLGFGLAEIVQGLCPGSWGGCWGGRVLGGFWLDSDDSLAFRASWFFGFSRGHLGPWGLVYMYSFVALLWRRIYRAVPTGLAK